MRVAIRGASRSWRRYAPRALTALPMVTATTARAAEEDAPVSLLSLSKALDAAERHEFAALALIAGVLVFTAFCAVMLVRTRARASAATASHLRDHAALAGELERTRALLSADAQVFVTWRAGDDQPEITGNSAIIAPPETLPDILAFDAWLDAPDSYDLARAVAALRSRGEGFAMPVTTVLGKQISTEGRVIGGRAVLRLREVGGIALQLAELAVEHKKLRSHVQALAVLLESVSLPVWVRDEAGRLTFVNRAYAQAVESDPADVIARGVELLDRNAREELRLGTAEGTPYSRRLPAVIAGHRRALDVLYVPTGHGSASIGIDATEAEALRGEVARMVDAHRSTLDQLATAVAIFDNQRRLTFYNAAYAQLWDLDAAFLDQRPDRLRRARPPARRAPPARSSTISASGARNCMKPIRRSSRASTSGICRTAARSAS